MKINPADIEGVSSTSFLGGPTQSTVRYQGQTYNIVPQSGESEAQALERVIGAGKGDVVNRDPTTGLVGPGNVPIQDWAKQVGGSPDAGVPAGYSAAEGYKPGFSGNYADFKGSAPSNGPAVKASTMTKEQFAAILATGSDPASKSTSLPTSSGYAASKAIESMIPQKQATQTDPNAPFPNLGPQPAAFNAAAVETTLSARYGLDSLLNQQAEVQDQISKIQNDLLSRQEALQAQGGVSSRVLSKEMTMATKAANQQLRDLRLQQTEITRSISIANKGISMVMSALKTDYANAKAKWEFDYNKNVEYYNTLDKSSTAADKQDKVQLQNMLNMLGTGKVKISDLTPDAQNTIDELILKQYGSSFLGMQNELSSGTAIYRKSFTGADGKKYMQTLYENPDGTFKTEYTTPAVGTNASTKGDIQAYDSSLQAVAGPDGFVSPDDFRAARDAWVSHGHTASSFNSTFKNFVNPSHSKDYIPKL